MIKNNTNWLWFL